MQTFYQVQAPVSEESGAIEISVLNKLCRNLFLEHYLFHKL